MARPKKFTVDYFPHMCTHKKTLFIIEQKFGNDGYAFWFKLLEMLGSTDGHALDLSEEDVWAYLQARTLMSAEKCTEILDLLSRLDAIDKIMWERKIVWSKNFIENISGVYKKRGEEIPSVNSFRDRNGASPAQSVTETPQSKVKESKVKDSTEKHIGSADFLDDLISDFSSLYEKWKGSKYVITAMGKERKSISGILQYYKKQKPENNSDECRRDIGILFNAVLKTSNEVESQYMRTITLTKIERHLNEYIELSSKNKRAQSSDEAILDLIRISRDETARRVDPLRGCTGNGNGNDVGVEQAIAPQGS